MCKNVYVLCCCVYKPEWAVARRFSTLGYYVLCVNLSELLLGDSPRLGIMFILCVNLSELLLGDSPRLGIMFILCVNLSELLLGVSPHSGMFAPE